MDNNGEPSSSFKSSSVQIPSSIPRSFRSSSPRLDAAGRETSTARLASPLPATSYTATPSSARSIKSVATPVARNESLATINNRASLPGPGPSALASALQDSHSQASGAGAASTPPRQSPLPELREHPSLDKIIRSNYGSFDPKSTDAQNLAAPVAQAAFVRAKRTRQVQDYSLMVELSPFMGVELHHQAMEALLGHVNLLCSCVYSSENTVNIFGRRKNESSNTVYFKKKKHSRNLLKFPCI